MGWKKLPYWLKGGIIIIIIFVLLLAFLLFGVGFHSLYKNQHSDGRFFYEPVPRPYFDLDKQRVVEHKVAYLGIYSSYNCNLWSGCSHSWSNWLTLSDKEITISKDCKIYYIEEKFNMADHYYTISCLVRDNFDICQNKEVVKVIGNSTFIHERTDNTPLGCIGYYNLSVIPNDPNVQYGKYHTVERWVQAGINLPTKEEPVKDIISNHK